MALQVDLFAHDNEREAFIDTLGIPHDGAPCIVCYGGGVDSTAMLTAMKREGVTPDLILFADTGGEKPSTHCLCKEHRPVAGELGCANGHLGEVPAVSPGELHHA